MTKEEIVTELNKILKTLQSTNAMDWNHRAVTRRSINKAYNLAEGLKNKLLGGTKD